MWRSTLALLALAVAAQAAPRLKDRDDRPVKVGWVVQDGTGAVLRVRAYWPEGAAVRPGPGRFVCVERVDGSRAGECYVVSEEYVLWLRERMAPEV